MVNPLAVVKTYEYISTGDNTMFSLDHVVNEFMKTNDGKTIPFDELPAPVKDYIAYSYLLHNKAVMLDYFGSEVMFKDGDINRYFELFYRGMRGEALTGLEYPQLNATTYFRAKLLESLYEVVTEAVINVLCNYQ
jgi:hypothetical protein